MIYRRHIHSRFFPPPSHILFNSGAREDYEYHIPVFQNPFVAELSKEYSGGVVYRKSYNRHFAVVRCPMRFSSNQLRVFFELPFPH